MVVAEKVAPLQERVLRHIQSHFRLPIATYRLQFNRAFTFRDATKVVPYLWELGISDCYASPYLKANPESMHGYDICDHNALNPSIGTEKEYNRFVGELKRRDMGQILDVVPNHMGIGSAENVWWMDVLENGPSSYYASFFDIDWDPVKQELRDRVILPILADQYGRVLENQELVLQYDDGTFFLTYYGRRLSVTPRSTVPILSLATRHLARVLRPDEDAVLELRSIITALGHLPPRTEQNYELLTERNREKKVIRRRLAELYNGNPTARTAIDRAMREYNGAKGDAASFDRLHALLEDQSYRLADWRVAAEEINYRRFFDVNELAAIRIEDPKVFQATHQLILRLLRDGKLTGLRVDHPDGLWDPAGYLRQVQGEYLLGLLNEMQAAQGEGSGVDGDAGEEQLRALFDAEQKERGRSPLARPLYVVVEKILQRGEELPTDWPVYGTTGYDFLNIVNGLFVDTSHKKAFDNIYHAFIGRKEDLPSLINSTKKMIMLVSLASEINTLARQLNRISERNRRFRDFTLNALTFAIREVIAALPVYRTYISAYDGKIDERDQRRIELAVAQARKMNPRTSASIFDFVRDVLLLRCPDNTTPDVHDQQCSFIMKFQQTSGPVMAKGLEDTLFYVYNRLTSLNEVGGDPGQFGITVESFHQQNLERLASRSHSLLCTSTHDTKRSEDVRARINVLSEIPGDWKRALLRWSKLNRNKKVMVDGVPAPDPNEEYFFYQTLLGAWPIFIVDRADYETFIQRMQDYMFKALKEAKINTSWVNPNTAYEEAVRAFVRNVLNDERANPFLQDFHVLQKMVSHYGMFNSLAQTLLKITSPGVPDFYQGSELWDFSLVDPDNRRPVDYKTRRRMLRALQRRAAAQSPLSVRKLARELVRSKEDGRIKLYVTWKALCYRRDNPDLFVRGDYAPLSAAGTQDKRVCAFARRYGAREVLVAVPRLIATLTAGEEIAPLGTAVWEDTQLLLPADRAGSAYQNIFTGEVLTAESRGNQAAIPLAKIFATFPVALLESVSTSPLES